MNRLSLQHRLHRIVAGIFIATAVTSFFSCQKKAEPLSQAANKLHAVVSILPHKGIAQKITGDLVDILVLVGEGQSPHSYEPSPRQMAELSKASVWFLSGTDFEISLLPKIQAQYPDLLIIDGTEGVIFRSMEDHSHEADEHHDEEHHNAEEAHHEYDTPNSKDRHTWLGRDNIKLFATHVANALTKLEPQNAQSFSKNLTLFIEETDTVFDDLKISLKPLSGSKAFVYHPAFGYFLDEFGISQFAVETGGKEPTAKTLNDLIELVKREQPTVLFVQAQFPVTAAKTVADAAGARVVPLNALAEDVLENIKQMGDELEATIR